MTTEKVYDLEEDYKFFLESLKESRKREPTEEDRRAYVESLLKDGGK